MLRHAGTTLGAMVAVLSIGLSGYGLRDSINTAKATASRGELSDQDGRSEGRPSASAGLPEVIDCGVRQSSMLAERTLSAFEGSNPATDYDTWFAGLQNADADLVAALRCSPGDGSLWADYALVLRQAVVPAERIVRALEMSATLAPATGPAVVTRAAVWWSLPDAAISNGEARNARDRDIDLFILRAEPKIVASVMREIGGKIGEEVRRIHEGASKKRKEEVAYALSLAAPPTTGGSAKGEASSKGDSLFDLLQSPKLD